MTHSRDFDRQIAAFLLDGPVDLPDRSFDAVRSEIERTRQRLPLGPWRVPFVAASARLLATATFVLIAFVGISLLGPRFDWGSGGPTPTPTETSAPVPSASATPPPSVSATPAPVSSSASGTRTLGGVSLPPGTYQLAPGFPVAATIDVPDGWSNCPENPLEQGVCVLPGFPAGPARVGLMAVENVVADPCEDVGLDPPVGPTVDDLVAAIRGLPGFESTDPVDVDVGGHAARELTLTAPPSSTCDLFTWSSASRTNSVGAGEINRLRIVDVGGTRVLIGAAWFPGQEASLPEIMGVLDSIRFPGSSGVRTLGDSVWQAGTAELAPGFPVAATIDVPAGWSDCVASPLEQGVCAPAISPGDAAGVGLMYVENVVAEPCVDVGLSPPVGPTVDDLVTAITNLDGFVATDPVDLTVDGHSGQRFTLTAPTYPTCSLRTWLNALRTNGVGPGEVNQVHVVDVDGTRVLLAAAWQPGQEEQIPEFLEVLDSIRFP